MNFGFIGAGNMAGAIVKGMTAKPGKHNDIYVTSNTKVSAKQLSLECNCNFSETAREVVEQSDVCVLGVKPYVLGELLPGLAESFEKKKPLVVSVAAGKTLSFLENLLPKGMAVVRVMPNINAKIGASTSGMCANAAVSQEQKAIVREMFETIGTVTEIPEQHFGIFSVIGGASVAFAYLYMDALAHAALKAGMPKKQALQITAETVLGSAKMILEGGEAPWPLIDQVCSPGGTTIEGVLALQKGGFESTLASAFLAVLEKDQLLGK